VRETTSSFCVPPKNSVSGARKCDDGFVVLDDITGWTNKAQLRIRYLPLLFSVVICAGHVPNAII
jgi:hypothetical protein